MAIPGIATGGSDPNLKSGQSGLPPDIASETQTVINDLNSNNFTGAWDTALSTSPLYGTSYGSGTSDPLLAALESSSGLKSLDPSKQWNSGETTQFYDALFNNPVYQGKSVAGMGGGNESLGQNPYGLWGSASALPSDIQTNISAEGATPDVGRFAGAKPGQSFLGKYGTDIFDAVVGYLTAGIVPAALGLAGAGTGNKALGDAGAAITAGAALGGAGFGAGLAGAAPDAASAASSTAALDASAAGDVAGGTLTSIGGPGLASLGAGTLDTGTGALGALGVAGDTSTLVGGAADAAGAAGATGDMLAPITVEAAAPAAAGGSALSSLLAAAGSLASPAIAAATGSEGAVNPITPAIQDTGIPYLASTNAIGSQLLEPSIANMFGIDTSVVGDAPISGWLDASQLGVDSFTGTADTAASIASDIASNQPALTDPLAGVNAAAPGAVNIAPAAGASLASMLSNPKNLGSLGLLGISALEGLSKPKLPGGEQTALNSANSMLPAAQSTIQSGGTATPAWAQQKASIDAQINQQIQTVTEQIQQAAASSGEGGANSGVVQQQIAAQVAQLNTQRQTLYAQAQQQNVSTAISELSGADQILMGIGNTQLAQSEEARQIASQTAELALMLQGGAGSSSLLSGIGNLL